MGKLNRAMAYSGVATTALLLAFTVTAWAGGQNWNDGNIQWMSYDAGLAEAKKSGKPICLIFYTTWCPHCSNYSQVFSDPDVVKLSKSFVMIRLDKDQNKDISQKYAPDGEYIPRTYFLKSDGQLDAELTEVRPQYKYFYDEKNPASILAGMERALKKLGTQSKS